ncbi:CaiB/BaiF CoA-transferase family protein [Mesorhizobium sp. KR2-14]|uniref:CaiB/BaiF CoA transferase family protein n=1 Tax=Mesorhizobium sp. KR2-14 TaxID=3156610 RepID=UPI0032B46A9D
MIGNSRQGPLAGLKVLEVEGIGGAPFAAMLLADLGADVLRIERLVPSNAAIGGTDPGPALGRGRSGTLKLDLKSAEGLSRLHALAERADGLIESFRPGVAERLGFGPDALLERNPALVYGRLTGWGREGPLAPRAGHDINYIAISGLLGAIGRPDAPPAPPLAIAGDMGGGGMLLALGMVAAFFERSRSGKGQVVDAAMVQGSALLTTAFWGFHQEGLWSGGRGCNLTDGGAPFYDCYICADGKHVAVGALEPKFFEFLCNGLGIEGAPERQRRENWPALRAEMTAAFAAKPQAHWIAIFDGTDACVTPVLDFATAPEHPQNHSRVFTDVNGMVQPRSGPEFSRTPCLPRPRRLAPDAETRAAWGLDT